MEKCIFCDHHIDRDSKEHVFLSAIGGRLTTEKAICRSCNNAFASAEADKIDDALAEVFKEVRNGLKIWSGRNGPPPTLSKAGKMSDGDEFDLAPGFVPIARCGRLPDKAGSTLGYELKLIARDEADAKKICDILRRRGILKDGMIVNASLIQQKAPPVRFSICFQGDKIWRSVAKTAVVGFVVFHGNENACRHISKDLRQAIRYGMPSISNFAGWDYTNEWPVISSFEAHEKTPEAKKTGFEHLLIIADVGEHSVAYIELFGGWRFSVSLGRATGLPVCGLGVNPRSSALQRFKLDIAVPKEYIPNSNSYSLEYHSVQEGIKYAYEHMLRQWRNEAAVIYIQQFVDDLTADIISVGEDNIARQAAIAMFAEKLAVLEYGGQWKTELAVTFDEDSQSLYQG